MQNEEFPKFISNKPCGKDLFKGGSQNKVAVNIVDHIKNDDTHTRLFGIDGEWGSGKSNVVGIIENKLADSHHVYIYDAWGHQEYLQRKSFLEELTENLIENDCLKERTTYTDLTGVSHDCTWKEKLTFLLSRKKNS